VLAGLSARGGVFFLVENGSQPFRQMAVHVESSIRLLPRRTSPGRRESVMRPSHMLRRWRFPTLVGTLAEGRPGGRWFVFGIRVHPALYDALVRQW